MHVAALTTRQELEHISWRHAHQEALGEHIVKCRVLGSFDLFVDEREKSLAPALMSMGFWESWITMAIARHLKPAMTVVDAGANFGYFTMLMAQIVGERGKVLAIEPHGLLNPLLQRSVVHNDLTQVTVDKRALWDSSTTLSLSSPGWLLGSSGLLGHGPPLAGESTTTQSVTSVALDDFELAPVDFVKIDCEGAEERIWNGMRETWKQSPQITVCAECAPTPQGRAFVEMLREEGLNPRRVGFNGSIEDIKPEHLNQLQMLWITKP